MIPRIGTGVLELLSGCSLIFQGIYLRYEWHTLSHSCTSRMQQVMYRSYHVTRLSGYRENQTYKHLFFQWLLHRFESHHSLFKILWSVSVQQITASLSFSSCADSVTTVSQKHSCQVYWKVKRWWYIHFWGLGPLLMATVIHLICSKYILPQCLTDCRGIDSLRFRRFTFSEDMLEIEN